MDRKLKLGTSFSPEYSAELGINNPLELLSIVVNQLGINQIRLGLRWNQIEEPDGKINLTFYRKYLDFLLNNNCKVCLNIGPIKTFRWPEEYFPIDIKIPENKIVNSDSDISKRSFQYLNNLLSSLRNDYGSKLDLVSFQLENEGFNRFGTTCLLMSKEYYIQLVKILRSYFPNNKLMVNSAGRRNLKKICSLFEELIKEKLSVGEQLSLGLNYYFKIPHTLPFFKRIEPLKFSFPFDMGISELHKIQNEKHFGLEISEAQFEPWGVQKSPGNSVEDFDYLIEKCLGFFPQNYNEKLIRLWGIEELSVKIFRNEINETHKTLIERILYYSE